MADPKKSKKKLAAVGILGVLGLIGGFEGRRLYTYRDPINIPTACYGETGSHIRMGQTYTDEQCTDMLAVSADKAYAGMMQCVRVELSTGEKMAYTSFAYNAGVAAFCKSTMLMLLNRGQHREACDQLPRWVYAGGKVLPGLVARRKKEKEVCLS